MFYAEGIRISSTFFLSPVPTKGSTEEKCLLLGCCIFMLDHKITTCKITQTGERTSVRKKTATGPRLSLDGPPGRARESVNKQVEGEGSRNCLLQMSKCSCTLETLDMACVQGTMQQRKLYATKRVRAGAAERRRGVRRDARMILF